jgi:16S rRNA (adenine1518-N6/adenine1519-N6)-dimethyltransferase
MQHRAKKHFGQNFLVDGNIIERIVSSICPHAEDCLIEIGPGLGALTRPLLQAAGKLDVIELDRDVIPQLQHKCLGAGKLTVHACDVLKFDFAALAAQCNTTRLRIVGNLPYNISTAVLFHCLEQRHLIQDMHFMLQKEVVERIAASPAQAGTYGRLTVMMQAWFKVSPLFSVSAQCFRPVPKVESAILRLTPHTKFHIEQPAEFATLVRLAFGQRRKTLKNTLKSICDSETLRAADIQPAQRAEELSVEDFVRLHQHVLAQQKEI